jgi:DNA-directed RNA polymerase specialized sigma24 family protein
MDKDLRTLMKHFERPFQINQLSSDRERSGDQIAWNRTTFRQMMEQYSQPLYRYYAVHSGGSFGRAQELTVETLSLIFQRTAPSGSDFAGWLFGIAWDVWNAHDHPEQAKATPMDEDFAHLSRSLTALRSLSFYPREALFLRFFARMDTKAIAALMDKSEANTKLLVYQGVLDFQASMDATTRPAPSAKPLMQLARSYDAHLDSVLRGTSPEHVVSVQAAEATMQLIALQEAMTMTPEIRAVIFSRMDQIIGSGNPSTTPL